MGPYLIPISHIIRLEIKGDHALKDKYPDGITLLHESDAKSDIDNITFMHGDVKIDDADDLNYLKGLYEELVGM